MMEVGSSHLQNFSPKQRSTKLRYHAFLVASHMFFPFKSVRDHCFKKCDQFFCNLWEEHGSLDSTPSPKPSVYHPLKGRFWPHKGSSFSTIFRGRFAVSGPTGKQQKHKIESNKTHAMIGSFQNVLSKKSFPINIDPKISHEQKRSHMIHMMLSQITKSPISSVQARNAILSSSHRCIF